MAKTPSFLDQLYFGQQPQAPLDISVTRRLERQGRGKRRNLNARVPRGPSISAPEPNKFEDIYNSIGQLASRVMPTGGDTRTTYQRGADYGQNIASALNFAPVSPHGLERAFLHGIQQLSGDRPQGVDTEDYINLFAPGAGYAIGAAAPLVRRIPGVDRALNYLRHTDEMPVDPDYIEGAFSVRPPADLAVPRLTGPAPDVAELAVPRLTGPAPPLALPAPGPGLPPLASKPRGGQFWTDRMYAGTNASPELAARRTRQGDVSLIDWQPDDVTPTGPGQGEQLGDWLERTLAKYYKTDFGAPEDPLRDLAERGLHYDPEMTPERWRDTVNSYLQEDRIGDVLLPPARRGAMPGAGDDLRAAAMLSMPWLAKQPVTDNIYGIGQGGLDLSHFTDEMRNAMDVASSGLPADLAVRPESLQRMTFPQAVEQVGRINQYRAKEMERAGLDAQNNPVTHVFKDYADDPRGMRWVEMAPPKGDGPTNYDVKDELGKALKYEGDTMGHCVGGYCPDVMSGKSRIFSLRDAKGEPHVTVETKPAPLTPDRDERYAIAEQARLEVEARGIADPETEHFNIMRRQRELADAFRAEREANPQPESIIQIKGKGNRAPKDDYLPFVQDFVKSGQWGNVGDLRNTQLVKLPDGRYITTQQAEEGIQAMPGIGLYSYEALQDLSPEEWAANKVAFEGYAIGGRVSADRCFTRNPLSVRR
jgi:hypothetical protein